MTGVGLVGAFLGGVASLVSPCSALLLPSFFAYAFDRVRLLMQRTVVFWLGLCLILVPLGAGVAAVGAALTRYRTEVTMVDGLPTGLRVGGVATRTSESTTRLW